jgi:hypothetical protein
VCFPGTHNSNSAYEYGYSNLNANHDTGFLAQLQAGVRVMLIDVTYEGGETMLCHGPCNLGSMPHLEGLAILHDFMVANPREILTIIYQDSIAEEDMEADFVTSGMIDMLYAHTQDDPWPTLAEMIEDNTRLVITAESGGPPPDWLHHVWDVGWDTDYNWESTDDMDCELNRGSTDNDLFLINHWVNSVLGTPSKENAASSNSYDVLHARLQQCWAESGRIPNFIAVDFFEQGDLFEAVASLNGLD